MERCQEKVRHMKILKNQYDLLKEESNFVQSKNEALDKDHIPLVKGVSDWWAWTGSSRVYHKWF